MSAREDPSDKSGIEDEEAVPFDDCLRFLVNTPPQPKKAQKVAEPKKQGKKEKAS